MTAFPARHEEMVNSFSFRFDTPDRTIVISGDTAPTQALLDHSRGCDVLIHEAYSLMEARHSPRADAGIPPPAPHVVGRTGGNRQHGEDPSCSSPITGRAKGEGTPAPGQTDVLVEEIRRGYAGAVVAANDLDVF